MLDFKAKWWISKQNWKIVDFLYCFWKVESVDSEMWKWNQLIQEFESGISWFRNLKVQSIDLGIWKQNQIGNCAVKFSTLFIFGYSCIEMFSGFLVCTWAQSHLFVVCDQIVLMHRNSDFNSHVKKSISFPRYLKWIGKEECIFSDNKNRGAISIYIS